MSDQQEFDVVVVGAGISGIDIGYRLQTSNPDLSYTILEGRSSIGGTWDLFKYPGLRSDSDMYTLGFPFEPWQGERSIAGGDDILAYIKHTASKYAIDQHIQLDTMVRGISWSSQDQRWTVRVERPDGPGEVRAKYVYFASGYYSYDAPYTPPFPGRETFQGQIVHPQFWPEDLDYQGKKVVVIGSGATAVTLVPALAERGAGLVTMLQRTPSYILPLPGADPVANQMRARMSNKQRAYTLTRWRNIVQTLGFYQFSRRMPKTATKVLTSGPRVALRGSKAYDPKHFQPPYKPWDQRVCIIPDGDLFRELKKGNAEIVTDTIAEFVPEGIRTGSGQLIEADIIVTATGLQMLLGGGADVEVDGEPVDLSTHFVYRGCMLEGVPNAALSIGYTNASWTLRSDLSAQFFCRVVKHTEQGGFAAFVPRVKGAPLRSLSVLDLTSGYVQRLVATFPKRGDRRPWMVRQNYLLDSLEMRRATVDSEMEYVRPGERPKVGNGTAASTPEDAPPVVPVTPPAEAPDEAPALAG